MENGIISVFYEGKSLISGFKNRKDYDWFIKFCTKRYMFNHIDDVKVIKNTLALYVDANYRLLSVGSEMHKEKKLHEIKFNDVLSQEGYKRCDACGNIFDIYDLNTVEVNNKEVSLCDNCDKQELRNKKIVVYLDD